MPNCWMHAHDARQVAARLADTCSTWIEPSVGILLTYGVMFASPSGTAILVAMQFGAVCFERRLQRRQVRLAEHVVRVDDAPLGAEVLDLGSHRRVVSLAPDREDAEGVLVARLGGRELLAGAAVERHVDHPQLGGQALHAEALGAEHAAGEHVDVVLLGELGRQLQRLGRVALGIDVDHLQRVAVDAAAGVGVLDDQVGADAHAARPRWRRRR